MRHFCADTIILLNRVNANRETERELNVVAEAYKIRRLNGGGFGPVKRGVVSHNTVRHCCSQRL